LQDRNGTAKDLGTCIRGGIAGKTHSTKIAKPLHAAWSPTSTPRM
jgi:hypothetical protein